MSSLVLTIYDHILTVSQEVEYVWRRKFTAATVLFLANRYLALVNICLMLQITWNDSVSVREHLLWRSMSLIRIYRCHSSLPKLQ